MATNYGALLAGMGGGPEASPFGGTGALPAGVATPSLPVPQIGAAPPSPFNPLSALTDIVGSSAPVKPPEAPIEKLKPGSDLHGRVRGKLDAMLTLSRNEMKKHYDRWNFNELKVQAYASENDYERIMSNMRGQKGNRPPEPVSVVVPYSYATLHAAATFISQVLHGRKPIFPLMATRGTEVNRARRMEDAIQSHLDASRAYEALWQGVWDSLLYGFGPKRLTWEERKGVSIKWVQGARQQVETTTFAGNVLNAIDPYRYFPDPRVPISECNLRGDFIFTESDISENVLRDMERDGSMKWIKDALTARGNQRQTNDSARQARLGIGSQGLLLPNAQVVAFRALMEGTVRLVPKDWGLGAGETSELWKFAWFEGGQIVQAEPLGMIHGQHPFTASEPTSFGHDFMSLSMADMIGNFQDILSWLVSSRMENVRAVVQNSFAVDPARIDVNDIRSSAIGRVIRLKQTAMGLPVKEAIMQIMVSDVTGSNVGDMQNIRILADTITGVNDNMRGIQNAGGRRSATEARIAMQNGGGRLSQHAVRISAQDYHPMVQQMISNTQQFMPEEMWIEQTGDDGAISSNAMTPEMLVGSFNYQISDGTLPFDKGALVEVWKEILMGVAQDPELRQQFSLAEIFRYTAELGGAKNIDSFKKQQQAMPMQAGAMADPAAQPGMMPVGPAMPQAPLDIAGALGG